jgi:hypothetical protein
MFRLRTTWNAAVARLPKAETAQAGTTLTKIRLARKV